jgi:hypothetical protein
MTTIKNVLNKIDSSIINAYKITEAFILNNELYVTSEWSLTDQLFERLENELITK